VSRVPANRWRRPLATGGRAALATKGAVGAQCKLTPGQVNELEAVLDAGPAACGYADQYWTLARIADQVWRRFGVKYTLAGMDVLACSGRRRALRRSTTPGPAGIEPATGSAGWFVCWSLDLRLWGRGSAWRVWSRRCQW
jgi:hypothetical protein